MADPNTEVLIPKTSDVVVTDSFNAAIHDLSHRFTCEEFKNARCIDLDQILDKVYEWENEYQDKVSENELEALQVLSLVLGTMKIQVGKKYTGTNGDKMYAYEQSVNTQRDVVRFVFQNFDSQGNPNQTVVRSFGLVSSVFENVLNLQTTKIQESHVIKELGFWQGVMGMVTAAQMFHKIGWEVSFPPKELDLEDDVDFVVKNPKGDIWSVDISEALHPSGIDLEANGGNLYYVNKEKVKHLRLLNTFPDLKGSIRLNIPPLWHYQSESFYDPACRKIGCPSNESMEKFRKVIEG